MASAAPASTVAALDPRRILILRGGALGDFILSVPVLSALRDTWPTAQITLLTGAANARLALFAGMADHVVLAESAAASALYSHNPSPDGLTSLGTHDLAVVLTADPDGLVQANLGRLGVTAIVSRDPRTVSGHACDYFAGVLRPLGVMVPDKAVPCLTIQPRNARFDDRRLVIVHPGSGSPAKNWPAASFRELADRVTDVRPDVEIAFSFGEADEALEASPVFHGPHRRLTGLDLPELAQVLAAAAAYVGNDSGVTHLAAAVGTSVTAIFGPTDENAWGPRGRKVRILRPEGENNGEIGDVPVASVLAALLEGLAPQA